MVMEMQHTYEEQQSNMGEMVRQVALLTVMIKEIYENIAKSEVEEKVKEEGIIETEKGSPANAEKKSEAPLEEAGTGEIESDAREMQTEEKSITTPPDDDVLQKSLEEAIDEPQKTEVEVIERDVEVDDTLFYLQSEKIDMPSEKVIGFITAGNRENEPEEGPPPIIDESEGCYYKKGGEPELRRKVARSIYWVQLQPWPEPLKRKKPLNPGLRPKENKKVWGTYGHHKKKRDLMVICLQTKSMDGRERAYFRNFNW